MPHCRAVKPERLFTIRPISDTNPSFHREVRQTAWQAAQLCSLMLQGFI